MDDSIPAIQPRPAIAPAGSNHDRRRRKRRVRDEAPAEPESEDAAASSNTRDPQSLDADLGHAVPGEPGTNLDLTA